MFLCLLFPFFQQDGELGHSVGGEKVGLRKAPTHTPYLHSRAGQDQTLIKAGYCVKQGALVSLRDFINLGLVELRVCVCVCVCVFKNTKKYYIWFVECMKRGDYWREFITCYCFPLISDEELEKEIFCSGTELNELLQVRSGTLCIYTWLMQQLQLKAL